MRLRQRAYLRIASDGLDPARISEIVGVHPDEAHLMGSRSPGPPPRPRSHLWYLRSGLPEDRTLDDHFEVMFAAIDHHAAGLRTVASSPETVVWLQVVRTFEEGDEDFDEATYGLLPDSPFERLSGQHPFLGWSLSPDRISLLAQVGIGLDVDEYG